MLLFAIIMFLSARQLLRQKANFFPSHFASISSCSACLVGLIWDINIVLYLENEPKYHLTIRTQEIGGQKWRKTDVEVGLTSFILGYIEIEKGRGRKEKFWLLWGGGEGGPLKH